MPQLPQFVVAYPACPRLLSSYMCCWNCGHGPNLAAQLLGRDTVDPCCNERSLVSLCCNIDNLLYSSITPIPRRKHSTDMRLVWESGYEVSGDTTQRWVAAHTTSNLNSNSGISMLCLLLSSCTLINKMKRNICSGTNLCLTSPENEKHEFIGEYAGTPTSTSTQEHDSAESTQFRVGQDLLETTHSDTSRTTVSDESSVTDETSYLMQIHQ